MTRTRRCSWETGTRCHEPASHLAHVTYLGEPIDHDPLFCQAHAEQAHTLLREGWVITEMERITDTTRIRNRPKTKKEPPDG